jgi:hypothetical protein
VNRTVRVGLFACATFAALAFAGSAFASFSPKLVVSSASGATGGGPTRVGVIVGASDDPTAEAQIFVPSAYTIGTPAAGTKLGNVTATAQAADLGNTVLPLTGELDAIAPNATTTADAEQCGISPTQTWDLHLSAAGQTLDIPMFVVTAAAPIATSGYNTELVVCLPPPDVPAGTPGRAVFGAKLLSATFTSSAITEPGAAGTYRWTSLWTPYTPNTGKPNPAGTVETQSVRNIPATLELKATRKKVTSSETYRSHGHIKKRKITSTTVTVSSSATENGKPASSAVVTITTSGKKITRPFRLASKKTAVVVATAKIDSDSGSVPTGVTATTADLFYHDLGQGGCVATAVFGGLPCIDATVGGVTVTDRIVVKGY